MQEHCESIAGIGARPAHSAQMHETCLSRRNLATISSLGTHNTSRTFMAAMMGPHNRCTCGSSCGVSGGRGATSPLALLTCGSIFASLTFLTSEVTCSAARAPVATSIASTATCTTVFDASCQGENTHPVWQHFTARAEQAFKQHDGSIWLTKNAIQALKWQLNACAGRD